MLVPLETWVWNLYGARSSLTLYNKVSLLNFIKRENEIGTKCTWDYDIAQI